MNTKLPFKFLGLLTAATFAATVPVQAGDDGATASVKLSAPGKPATLRVEMPWADIRIVGGDGDTVTVESTLNQQGGKDTREDGLRRLDDEVSFELNEKDNVVSLRLAGDNPWASHDAEFKVFVPRAMALDVKTEAGGDLAIRNIDGDIEISNMNGEVLLEGITGSTVVNTMNGEVRAVYARAPQKLVSITSMNGEVELRVPSDTKANVRLRTHNGSILTDFDESVLKTKSEGKGSSYNAHGIDAARIGADAARVAADATRMAMQIAREVSREVKQEVERAVQEESAEATPAPGAAPEAAPRAPHAPRAPRAPRAPIAPIAPIPPITGGKTVSGTLNGGGVDIKISTMNGEITLRKSAATETAAGHAPRATTPKNQEPAPVTVVYQEPDNFMDVRENGRSDASTALLDELREYLQKTAAPRLAAGEKLVITITDIDLAGETLTNQPDQIRVMREINQPRIKLKFQLLGADGSVRKEGERNLTDSNYLMQSGRPGSGEPLYYDKQLLREWLAKEFKAGA